MVVLQHAGAGSLATARSACVDWDNGSFFCAANNVYRPILDRQRGEWPETLVKHQHHLLHCFLSLKVMFSVEL